MKWFLFIFISCISISSIHAQDVIAEIIDVSGQINISPTKTNKIPSIAIPGRDIHSGDVIRSSIDSYFKILFLNSTTEISIYGSSEIKIETLK